MTLTSGVSFCDPHDCEAQGAVADHFVNLTRELDPVTGWPWSVTQKIIDQAIGMDCITTKGHWYVSSLAFSCPVTIIELLPPTKHVQALEIQCPRERELCGLMELTFELGMTKGTKKAWKIISESEHLLLGK